jgi:hypothetical protein
MGRHNKRQNHRGRGRKSGHRRPKRSAFHEKRTRMPEKRSTLFLFKPQQSDEVDRIDELRLEARSIHADIDADHSSRLAELEQDWNLFKQRVRLMGAEYVDTGSDLVVGLEQGYTDLTEEMRVGG